MSVTTIEFLHSARRLSGREEFHRHLFESMLGGQWRRREVTLAAGDEAVLLDMLSRWIREASVKDELGVVRLLAVRGVVRSLVAATGTKLGVFLLDVLALDAQDVLAPHAVADWKLTKLACLADASVLSAQALQAWQARYPLVAQLAAIACLDACPLDAGVARETGHIGRWLMAQPPVALPLRYLEQLQTSAFFVSYLADPDRHAFKHAIVRQAAFMLKSLPLPRLQPAQARAEGPLRLTIVGELLFPQHAMFRCYAEQLSGLKQHFHVTLVADEPTRCAEHGQFSHAQKYFPPHERDPAKLALLVAATTPDIVLYPSIGMSYWTFVLSMLRLAPLQLMSVGHPAPACSGQIDGTLVHAELAGKPLPEYGRLFSFDKQALPAPPPGGWQTARAPASDACAIAVNAAQMKLTPAFLALVAATLAAAPADTGLHFFPNAAGIELLALRRALQLQFPTAQVHAATSYAEYMGMLAGTSVVLQSFPFGGTNTAMDALALGVPLVCLAGDDLAARVDPLLLRRAGLAQLCAADQADYLALAQRLLASPEERARIMSQSRTGFAMLAQDDALGQRTLADAVVHAWQTRAG